MTRRTPLHDVHVALGAQLTDFAGWSMPVRYGSDLAEHHAVRRQVGMFDLSHMGEIELTGRQAADALDHAVVTRLSGLAVGRARYTMLCAPDGGVLDDVIVYRRGTERFLVVANAANTGVVARELTDRAAGFDAQVADRSGDTALVAVQGPSAAAVLAGAGMAGLDGLRYFAGTDVEVAGVAVWLARTGYTGEDGFELYVPAGSATAVWEALTAAGAPHGLVPCGLACRDTLRLEAGMPLYGHELDATRTPYAAGMGRIVDLDDDRDFVGRSALEGARDPGELLVGLVSEGRRAPRAGNPVHVPDGEAVGTVTSGVLSPTLEQPIALAYVAAHAAGTGTSVEVDVRGRRLAAEVVEPPFYRRGR